ncbi:MAG: ABC transporter ATP-binding protein, partial [Hyphomicrobiales bacterium]
FYARALGYKGQERRQRIDEVMDFTDLVPLADRFSNKLSKGMTQRLGLGRALLHDPQVLIMDEPAAGLDPKARVELKHLIRVLAKEGKTIFISSHILSELGEMCDSLLFINNGRIIHHGDSETLRSGSDILGGVLYDVQVDGKPETIADWARRSGCRLRRAGGFRPAVPESVPASAPLRAVTPPVPQNRDNCRTARRSGPRRRRPWKGRGQ